MSAEQSDSIAAAAEGKEKAHYNALEKTSIVIM